MTRVDSLPEQELINRLNKLKADFEEIKTHQLLGADSIRNYRVFSDDEWDITESVPTWSPSQQLVFDYRVTFTPETTNPSAGAVYRLDYVYDPLPEVGGAFNTFSMSREKITTGNIQTWLVRHFYDTGSGGGTGFEIRIKFYFFSTSPGTFSVVAI